HQRGVDLIERGGNIPQPRQVAGVVLAAAEFLRRGNDDGEQQQVVLVGKEQRPGGAVRAVWLQHRQPCAGLRVPEFHPAAKRQRQRTPVVAEGISVISFGFIMNLLCLVRGGIYQQQPPASIYPRELVERGVINDSLRARLSELLHKAERRGRRRFLRQHRP